MSWLLKGFGQCVHVLFGICLYMCTEKLLPFCRFALQNVISISHSNQTIAKYRLIKAIMSVLKSIVTSALAKSGLQQLLVV